jgi:hypothetical protein
VNLEEINLTIKDLQAEPGRHNQGSWAARVYSSREGEPCRTTMCMAGATVARHGYTFIFEEIGNVRVEAVRCVSPDGEESRIPHAAAQILGLTPVQADALFLDADDLDDIIRYRDLLAAGHRPVYVDETGQELTAGEAGLDDLAWLPPATASHEGPARSR